MPVAGACPLGLDRGARRFLLRQRGGFARARGEAMRRLSRRRKEQIVMAYVLATGGRLPTHLGELLRAMRRRMGPVTEEELRRAIAWSLAQSRRSGAAFERKLRAARTMSGADRGAAP